MSRPRLLVVETHPVQYHAPVYRCLQEQFGVPVTAVYGTDASVHAYRDAEFGADVTWDVDLLGGYSTRFLSTVAEGGPADPLAASARGIGRVLDEELPEAVLIVGYSPAFHRQAWRAAWRRGIPILFRGETTDIRGVARGAAGLVRDVALAVAYRSCAALLYIGQRSRRHFERVGVAPDRLVFSPYCVDVAPFQCDESDRERLRPDARRELGLDDDEPVIAFSGKLSERKGVDLLPRAAAAVADAVGGRVTLLCLGDGALRGILEAAHRPDRGVSVRVLGVQSQATLSRWYHAADVLALPSRHGETWGLVVNEALHHGLPVVVSDRVGSAPDLVTTSTGAICEAGSLPSLSEALVERLRLPTSAWARDARRRHVAGYSVERAAAGLADAVSGLVGRRSVA